MKVLFLDIDGVCNSRDYLRRGRAKNRNFTLWNVTDPDAVRLVRRIVRETGCVVVLSSTWRLYPESVAVVRRDVCRIMDCTPDLQRGYKRGVVERGREVKAWLDEHPEVTQYAIIDDDSDFLPHQWHFRTTFEKGLTEDTAQAVINHLNTGKHYEW